MTGEASQVRKKREGKVQAGSREQSGEKKLQTNPEKCFFFSYPYYWTHQKKPPPKGWSGEEIIVETSQHFKMHLISPTFIWETGKKR